MTDRFPDLVSQKELDAERRRGAMQVRLTWAAALVLVGLFWWGVASVLAAVMW